MIFDIKKKDFFLVLKKVQAFIELFSRADGWMELVYLTSASFQ